MPKYSYDSRCEYLARVFLEDAQDGEPHATPENIAALAQDIQDAIEAFMSGNRSIA